LAQKLLAYGIDRSGPGTFDVNGNAPITPFQGQYESPPSLDQKIRPLTPPVTLQHLSSSIENDRSSSVRVSVGKGNQRRRLGEELDNILPSIEGDGIQVEVLPADHQVESSLESNKPLGQDERLPNPFTYHHQDGGWRDPVEFKYSQNQTVEGREVNELAPDYLQA